MWRIGQNGPERSSSKRNDDSAVKSLKMTTLKERRIHITPLLRSPCNIMNYSCVIIKLYCNDANPFLFQNQSLSIRVRCSFKNAVYKNKNTKTQHIDLL